MHKNGIIKIFVIAIISFISLVFFSGCGKKDEFITVDVFCSKANYQGIQGGWFGKVVKEKFNMEINIIAPNVAGGGDLLYQTRAAAGNLGDIVMISSENGRLEEAVTAGLLLDMTQYQEQMPNATQYTYAIEMIQKTINKEKGIYAIPSTVTSYDATEPAEGTEPTYGPYLRWDLYMKIGAPQMSTLEDLLPVLKEMQQIDPKSLTGERTYAFSFFKDWDGNMMTLAKQPACFYGYDEVGFVLNKADGSDYISILDDDSPYIRALRFYYEANQLGLVDPESTTQTWDTVWNKYVDGELLFSPWPWQGQAAYNTVENLEAGRGFMLAPIDDIEIFSYGATLAGSDYVIGIGSEAKDPERMAEFIDWLYSPEGIMISTSQTGSTCGPEGLTWEMVNGYPELTKFGIQAMLEGGAEMPEEWGGGSWNDGTSQINFISVLEKDINPETGFSYDFRYWESYLEFVATPVHKSWQEKMNALSTFEYLIDHEQYIVAPGTDYIAPTEPDEISILRNQCSIIVIENSWKMIFAKDAEEFEKLLNNMQQSTLEMGYQRVLDFDIEITQELNIARDKVSK